MVNPTICSTAECGSNKIEFRIAKVAIIAVGLPASGKTSYLKPLAQEIGATYICPDDIRQQLLGDARDQSQNGRIWGLIYAQIDEALISGSVVIDGMGIDPVYRQADVDRYKQHGARVIAYHFVTPLEICLERNRLRERQVSEDVIRSSYEHLQAHPPMVEEGFDEVVMIR